MGTKRLDPEAPFKSKWKVHLEREFWDSGLAAELGPYAGYVYLAMRAYTRAKGRHGREEGLLAQGFIISPVRHETLSKVTGVSRRVVIKAIGTLEEAGWIQVDRAPGKPGIYLLGHGDTLYVHTLIQHRTCAPSAQVEAGDLCTRVTGEAGDLCTRVTGEAGDLCTRVTGDVLPSVTPPVHESNRPYEETGEEETEVKKPDRDRARKIRPAKIQTPITTRGSLDDDHQTPQTPRRLRPREAGTNPRAVGTNPRAAWAAQRVRHMASARARRIGDATAYTSHELVALWCMRYEEAFGVPDADLRTKAAWQRAAKLLEGRIGSWFEGDRTQLRRYLGAAIDWWARQIEAKAQFPTGLPRLAQLLEQKRGGAVSYFYKHWQAGGMRKDA